MTTDAARVVALTEATKVSGTGGDVSAVLKTAKVFYGFLTGADGAATPATTTGATIPATKPTPAAKPTAAAPSKKPVAAKPTPAKPPVKTEEEAAAEILAAADAEAAELDAAEAAAADADVPEGGATEADVSQVVSDLLAAQKRPELVELLKKFGATSRSGVKPADYDKFVAKGNEILLSA